MVACSQIAGRTAHGDENLIVHSAWIVQRSIENRHQGVNSPCALQELPMKWARGHVECTRIYEHMATCERPI